MTTHVTKAATVANKMVNGNNSNAPSHNNVVTNGASVNALNAANLSGTSAAPTNNTDFGDNINSSKSEFFFLCFFHSLKRFLVFFVANLFVFVLLFFVHFLLLFFCWFGSVHVVFHSRSLASFGNMAIKNL